MSWWQKVGAEGRGHAPPEFRILKKQIENQLVTEYFALLYGSALASFGGTFQGAHRGIARAERIPIALKAPATAAEKGWQ